MRDECLNMLNLMGRGDISKETYDDICEQCIRCSNELPRISLESEILPVELQNQPTKELHLWKFVTCYIILKLIILSILSSQLDIFHT